MTIAVRAAGTPTGATAAVTAINPAAPSGWQSGDISVLAVQVKPDTASITTPANWTKIGEWTGGTGSVGVDTGPTKTALYYRLDSPAAPGNLALTGASAAAAVIHIFSKTLAEWNVENFTSAADTTHGANVATATGTNITLANGDLLLVNWAGANDGGAISSPAVAATGSTFGTATKRSEVSVTTGNDLMGATFTAPVTGGPSTGGPSFSGSNTLNSSSGHASFLRLREQAATVKHGDASGSISVTGEATGSSIHHGPASGTISATGGATGSSIHHGTAGGSATPDGSASGAAVHRGTANGAVSLSGAASGSVNHRGAAEGAIAVDGSASGSTAERGSADGLVTVIGGATGSAPAAGVNHGSADGIVQVDGSAVGHAVMRGSANGAAVVEGGAVGSNTPATPEPTVGATAIIALSNDTAQLVTTRYTASVTPRPIGAGVQTARYYAEVIPA